MTQHSTRFIGEREKSSHASIKQWPKADRPREKLFRCGPEVLSDAEILALLIGSGTGRSTAVDLARMVLVNSGGIRHLAGLSAEDLLHQKVRGLGPARAAILIAAFELSRRIRAGSDDELPIVRSPQDVADRMIPKLRDLKHELFMVLVLDSSNHITKEIVVTKGLLNSSLTHPREVFKPAIVQSAASIILVHNHPSGNCEPSAEDLAITRQLVDSGKILGITVHDHLIVAGNLYTSFAERGILI